MSTNCQHSRHSKPHKIYVRGVDTDQFIGEAIIDVCLECCHTKGVVKTGLLFNPAETPFEVADGRNIERHAREALLSIL